MKKKVLAVLLLQNFVAVAVNGFVQPSSSSPLTFLSLSSSSTIVSWTQQRDHRRYQQLQQQRCTLRTNTAPATSRKPFSTRTQLQATGLFQLVDTLWKANPYAAAAIVCGVKASTADFIAQNRQNRKAIKQQEQQQPAGEVITMADSGVDGNGNRDDASSISSSQDNSPWFDKRRNLGFMIYGSAYQGVAQEYIYNTLYPMIFGTGGDALTVIKMVSFDLFVQTTFITLPIAYYFKSMIFGTSFVQSTKNYLSDVRHHGLLTKYFALWGPVQAMTFSIIPHHFRITFIALVSFFWVIILSSISSRGRPQEEDVAVTTPVNDDSIIVDTKSTSAAATTSTNLASSVATNPIVTGEETKNDNDATVDTIPVVMSARATD